MVRGWGLGLLLVVTLAVRESAGAPAGLEQEGQRAFLDLYVNQVEKGDSLVFILGDDVWVRVADLERAGLRAFAGRRETVSGEAYVSLVSLAPGIRFEFDAPGLALRLTAEPAFLPSTAIDLQRARPPGLIDREDPGVFFNYAVRETTFTTYSLFGEAGLSLNGALLFSSATRNDSGVLARGISNLTVNDRARLIQWGLGDRLARSDALGGTLLMGGLSASREFGLDPYFVSFPTVGLRGAVLTPSTADVYVNDRLVRREPVPPGAFQLRNVPAPAGSGVARVVLRDAFGREQEIVSPFYFTTAVLSRGLHDFEYDLGARRQNLGTESWQYDRPGFLGRHRVGVTDALTMGLRLELAADLASGGPSLTARLPFGEIDLAAAASRERDAVGAAGSLAYRYLARPFSFGATLRVLSDGYTTLALDAQADRPRTAASAFAASSLGSRGSVTLQYTRSDFRDRGPEDRVSVGVSINLTKRVSLILNGSRANQRHEPPTTEVLALLSVSLGDRNTGTVSYERRGRENSEILGLERSLPVGNGFGYRLRGGQAGDETQASATLQYQGPYGRYEGTVEKTPKTADNTSGVTSTLSVAGGIVALGGRVFATRPVSDGYGMIRVPGVSGVRGYLNNQEIGRTDARGDLLVPTLLPYYGNRLGVAAEDLPLDYEIATTEQIVAPPLRGGAVVTFPAQRLRAVTGRILVVLAGQTVVPAYGELSVTAEGRQLQSPLGREGEFYLENVPAGRHPAAITYGKTMCSFLLEVPADAPSLSELGTLRCVVP